MNIMYVLYTFSSYNVQSKNVVYGHKLQQPFKLGVINYCQNVGGASMVKNNKDFASWWFKPSCVWNILRCKIRIRR